MSDMPPSRIKSATTPIHKVILLPVPGAATAGSAVPNCMGITSVSVLSGSSVALGGGSCVGGNRVGVGVLTLDTDLNVQTPASNSANHLAR